MFASRRSTVLCQSLASALALFVFIIILNHERINNGYSGVAKERQLAGFVAATLSVAFAAAPLSSLTTVFRQRSTQALPFYLIFMT